MKWENVILILFIGLILLVSIGLYIQKSKWYLHRNDVLFVQPMWGIGNRLRVIRKAYELSKLLHRRLVLIEKNDAGFDDPSMKRLFQITNIDFIAEKEFNKFKQTSLTTITNLDHRCEAEVDIQNLRQIRTQLYINSCDIYNDDLIQARSFYVDIKSIFNDKAYQKTDIRHHFRHNPRIKSCSKVVGVHVRQGSIADYKYGNFFGKWDNQDDSMCPYFPQFADESRNLSATHPSAPPIEKYIQQMRNYDDSVVFFVCADRIGTLLYLHQRFPGRVIMNPLILPDDKPNSKYGLQDFLMLSKCDELIVSQIGSFSTEASFIRNIHMYPIV